MKKLFHLLLIMFAATCVAAQPAINRLVKKADELQQARIQYYNSDKRDAVFQKFDSAMAVLFLNKEFYNYNPGTSDYHFLVNPAATGDSLTFFAYAFMNNIVICSSADGRLRVFSWDDLLGGSSHSYTNFIQFQASPDSCSIIPFDTSENIYDEPGATPEVGYYDIKQVSQEGRTFYFLFGYGTYGGGQQHNTLRIFEIQNNSLVECMECYPGSERIIIYHNRGQGTELKFDEETRELSYRKYKFSDDDGFYTDEYERVKLKFENGRLVKN